MKEWSDCGRTKRKSAPPWLFEVPKLTPEVKGRFLSLKKKNLKNSPKIVRSIFDIFLVTSVKEL